MGRSNTALRGGRCKVAAFLRGEYTQTAVALAWQIHVFRHWCELCCVANRAVREQALGGSLLCVVPHQAVAQDVGYLV